MGLGERVSARCVIGGLLAGVAGLVVGGLLLGLACHCGYLAQCQVGLGLSIEALVSPDVLLGCALIVLLIFVAHVLIAKVDKPDRRLAVRRYLKTPLAIGVVVGVLPWFSILHKEVTCDDGLIRYVSGQRTRGARGADPAFSASWNSVGLRGAEVDKTRPRVLLVGDSFTFGSGVADAQTIAVHLESMIGGPQVINGGMEGDSLQGYLVRANHYAKTLKPSVIIFVVLPSDLQASSSSSVCQMPWLCRSRVPFWRAERLLSIEMDKTGRIADHVMERIEVLAAKLRETCAALGIEVIVYRFASSMPRDQDVERWFPGSLRHTAHEQLAPRHYFDHAGSSHLNSSGNREIATYLARTLRSRGALGER